MVAVLLEQSQQQQRQQKQTEAERGSSRQRGGREAEQRFLSANRHRSHFQETCAVNARQAAVPAASQPLLLMLLPLPPPPPPPPPPLPPPSPLLACGEKESAQRGEQSRRGSWLAGDSSQSRQIAPRRTSIGRAAPSTAHTDGALTTRVYYYLRTDRTHWLPTLTHQHGSAHV